MAITVNSYRASDFAAAMEKARELLDASGIFDSVTYAEGTVTCTKGDATLATITLTVSRFNVTFGGRTLANETSIATFIISSTSKGVFVTFTSSNSAAAGKCFSVIFANSSNGKAMCFYSQAQNRSYAPYAEDTSLNQAARSSAPIRNSAYFAELAGIAVADGTVDTVSVMYGVYYPVTAYSGAVRGAFTTVTIGGNTYLSDGDFYMLDA